MGVSREQLIFDAFANTSRAESNLTSLGRKTAAAGDHLMALAKRLDDVSAKSADARVNLKGDKEALAQLDRLDLKMASVGRRVMDPKVTVEGAARAAVELAALDVAFDKVGSSAEKAAGDAGKSGIGALAGSGGFPGGGIGALIAAGVAVSPVIATLSVGLAGFGAAAAGVAAPIMKAAHAAGGLQANMAKLDPEQQKVARGLLGLGQQFDAFEKSLKPQVLGVFNQGVKIAGHLMRDVQPVAKATGTALGGMLAQIDKTFQSGTWQQFFGFMARTAGPDIALLTTTFSNLTLALPPLLELLQPTATDILAISAAASKLVKAGADASGGLDQTAQHENILAKTTDLVRTALFAPGVGLYHALKLVGIVSSGPAATGIMRTGSAVGDLIHPLGDAARHAGLFADNTGLFATQARNAKMPVFHLNDAVKALNTSMTTLVGNLLTLQGSNVGWRQSMQAAQKQLRSNTAGLEGNSAKALANKAAVIAATNSAIQFAGQQLALGKNIGGASRTVQAQIGFLQGLHDKSKFVQDEIHALREEEQKLQAQRIHQIISIGANATWSVTQLRRSGVGPVGSKPLATGGRVPGYGGGDRYPALLEGGEAVVPKHLTPVLAPFLKAHGVPGFAAGGLVPAHSGLPGMTGWIRQDDAATIRIIDAAVAKIAAAGARAAQKAAQAFAGGPGGPGTHASMPYLEGLWDAAGGPAGLAHLMAAIAMAESGGNAGAYNASGATGLWQILGAVDPRDQPFLRNPQVNAHEAVLKYRSQGLGAWVTYTNGAYKAYYARGGRVPGYGGGDRWPALLEGGEAVVPKRLTPAVAPFLKAHGVPGFAQGGLAGTLSGLGIGTASLWADIHRFLKDIRDHFNGQEQRHLTRVVMRQADDMADARASLRRIQARVSSASRYAGSVISGLSGYAALSGLSVGGGFVGKPGGGERRLSGGQMIAYQLQGKLGALRKWSGLLRRLSGMGAPASILRQIVDMGPDDGVVYAQELIAGGPKLMRQLSGLEGQISAQETRIGRGAASAVYTGHYITGRAVGRAFDSQEAHLRRLFGRLGNELGREAARWLHGRARKFDSGGWLHPGATLAVNNTGSPERVLPPGSSGGWGSGPLVRIDQMVVQDATDVHLVAQRLSFSITAAGLGS